jgi:two-component system OmpR family sensor kinase/two-component system sensor histidine kinase QseC
VSNGKPRVGSGAPSDGSDTQLRGDPRLLRVLADNLVANALRFSNGRPVEVAVLRDDPSHVTLTVRDHGPGVPEPDRARVFERFFRVEASQPKSNGAGLGLAIVAEIARLHAAECALEDAAPGARVRVRFPIA